MTGGLLHFIFHLFRISAVISIQTFRKSVISFWGTLLGLFIIITIFRLPPKDRLRIACFPIESSESDRWLDIIITDHMNDLLGKANPHRCLAYPLDWSFDAAPFDSTSNVFYLKSFGRRIGLDYMISEKMLSKSEDGYWVVLSLYDLKKDTCLFQQSSCLPYTRPRSFFEQALLKISNAISVKLDMPVDFETMPFSLWESYGWGRYYQVMGNFHEAERYFRRGSGMSFEQTDFMKGLVNALLMKALHLQTESKFTEDIYLEAADILRQIIEKDSTDGQAFGLLGRLYVQSERWNQAEKALHEALNRVEDDPWVYFNLSRLHPSRYNESGYKNKEQLLEKALYLNPVFEQAWLALGDELYFQNRPDEAEEAYLKLLDIHPKSLDALLALGKIYVFRNDVLNIVRVYEKVLQLSPQNPDAFYNLGIAYYNDEKRDEAIRLFQRAIEINDHIDSHYYLGVIFSEKGDSIQAIDYFRNRVRLKKGYDDPFAEEARKHLGQLLYEPE